MLSFENDSSRAAHPAVLEAVAEANNHLYSGYGSDELSDQAKAKIREACGQPDADVCSSVCRDGIKWSVSFLGPGCGLSQMAGCG